MENDKISVVIPACNEARFIKKTVQSVLAAECNLPIEVIVVCNGCSDNTAMIARQSGACVLESQIQGCPEASNLGASKSTGNILVFLDADTVVAPNLFIEIEMAFKAGFVGGRTVIKWDSSKFIAKIFSLVSYVHRYKWGGCCFVEKRVFLELGGYKSGAIYGFDFDLGRRVTESGRVTFLKNTYVVTSSRRFNKEGWLRHALLAVKRYYLDSVIRKKGVKYKGDIDYKKH